MEHSLASEAFGGFGFELHGHMHGSLSGDGKAATAVDARFCFLAGVRVRRAVIFSCYLLRRKKSMLISRL